MSRIMSEKSKPTGPAGQLQLDSSYGLVVPPPTVAFRLYSMASHLVPSFPELSPWAHLSFIS